MNVGEEHERRRPVALRQHRTELVEDVEIGIHRLAAVQIGAVLALPAERLTGHPLQPGQINATAGEDPHLLLREVVADHGHQPHISEEGCRHTEERRGAPDHTGRLAGRCLD